MNRKYILESAIKISRLARMIAKGVDLFIVLILSVFFYPVGILLAVAYIVICDSLQQGQSVGKRFMGFAVISLENGKPCSLKQSAIRNLPLSIPLIFAIVPLWGWVFAALVGIPMVLLEVYLLFRLDSGHRLGDVMADTSVMANDNYKAVVQKGRESWFDYPSSTDSHSITRENKSS
ncbi:MAG: hypothetical protein HN353_00710 [Bdellovibrionales bacterium]|jgi:uncharacterized RDD family membrane protein YckC|nr:hypothetical protein [Bdellovibrionales bacterium]MBT3524679.1 hypothetical protein [Bdellovibrionales bacterium]MBT7668304.1 hypothetical protein [Bdellovibrionales bacterium]MBT7766284.1 hypothetical protein [Bdellovibrionales bacterium]